MKLFKKLDNELHFWSGAMVGFLALFFWSGVFDLPHPPIAVAVAIVLAACGKEFYDVEVKHGKFSWEDIKFTVLGGLFFVVVAFFK